MSLFNTIFGGSLFLNFHRLKSHFLSKKSHLKITLLSWSFPLEKFVLISRRKISFTPLPPFLRLHPFALILFFLKNKNAHNSLNKRARRFLIPFLDINFFLIFLSVKKYFLCNPPPILQLILRILIINN